MPITRRKCYECKETKSIRFFPANKRQSGGYAYQCKDCINSSYDADSARKRRALQKLENGAALLVKSAKERAKKRGLSFDLNKHIDEIQAIIDSGKCQMTGVEFYIGEGRFFNTPSIDRINPKDGYIFSNIRIICWGMNAALGDWGEEKLMQMINGYINTKEIK